MEKYIINVTEVNYGFIEVKADSIDDACNKAEKGYHQGNVCWSSSKFVLQESKLDSDSGRDGNA